MNPASTVQTATTRRVGLICNPLSDRNRKHLTQIEQRIGACKNIIYIPTPSADAVPAAVRQLATAGIDCLAINGGDGTVAHVLTHWLRQSTGQPLPDVVLLPGGTTNMTVGDVGLRGPLLRGVEALIEWADCQRPTRQTSYRPVLAVRNGDAAENLHGMIFGTGAVVQAIEYWHERVKSSGFRNEFSSGLAMLRTVWGLIRRDPRFARPVSVDIRWGNQKPLQLDTMLMAVSTMRRVFLGFTPFWGQEAAPLHMTVIRDRAERFLLNLPAFLRGRPNKRLTSAAGYHSHNLDEVSINMNGAFTLDGDIYQARIEHGPVVIRHHCDLRFLRF